MDFYLLFERVPLLKSTAEKGYPYSILSTGHPFWGKRSRTRKLPLAKGTHPKKMFVSSLRFQEDRNQDLPYR